MANIGTFKKSGHEFQGEIVTLSLQSKGVRIVPETDRASDNAPSQPCRRRRRLQPHLVSQPQAEQRLS
jgi:uncharacterized protein (DUF736 family)